MFAHVATNAGNKYEIIPTKSHQASLGQPTSLLGLSQNCPN